MKERCLQNYKNYLFWQPYYHCLYGSLVCLEEPRSVELIRYCNSDIYCMTWIYCRWSNAEKYHALKPSTLSDLLSFANVFLRNVTQGRGLGLSITDTLYVYDCDLS